MEEIIVIGQPHMTKAGLFYIIIRSVFSALISFLEVQHGMDNGRLDNPCSFEPCPIANVTS
jgi:hypothetical protein